MDPCTWCGQEVETDDGFRAYEPAGERRAVFCRLEHLIPWSIQGAHWEAGALDESPSLEEGATTCSHCGVELGDAHDARVRDSATRLMLVRHRGEHRVGDAFCSVDHMTEWAKAGGRWQ